MIKLNLTGTKTISSSKVNFQRFSNMKSSNKTLMLRLSLFYDSLFYDSFSYNKELKTLKPT